MIVKVCDVTKSIGGRDVLSHASLYMRSGEVTGLWGINGSGKTMLMRAICGFIRPNEGHVEIDGKVIGREMEFPPSVGALIESPAFVEDKSALWNLFQLALVSGRATRDDAARSLRRVGLDPQDTRPVRKYSLGMRQRAGIALAIMEAPDLIVLDEPSNGLDERGTETLCEIVLEERARGAALLVSCHDRALLERLSDRIYRIADGVVSDEEACDA